MVVSSKINDTQNIPKEGFGHNSRTNGLRSPRSGSLPRLHFLCIHEGRTLGTKLALPAWVEEYPDEAEALVGRIGEITIQNGT